MKRSRAGFTLLELIVVLGLIGVVTSMGIQAFGAMNSRWRDTKTRVEMLDRSDAVLASLRRDLQTAPSSAFTGVAIGGESRRAPDNAIAWAVEFADDSLLIPVSDSEDPGRLLLVRYSIERGVGAPRLQRVASHEGQVSRSTLAEGVAALGLAFREHPGAPWQPAWDARHMPGQVAVSIVMVNPDNPADQLARREVVTIHVD